MHLYDGEQHFEGKVIDRDTILVRGEVGGRRPELVHPDRLLEMARCETEQRQTVRRLGPTERRHRHRGERRGHTATYLSQRGRRREDVFSWDDDEALAGLTRRLQQRAQEQARQQRAG